MISYDGVLETLWFLGRRCGELARFQRRSVIDGLAEAAELMSDAPNDEPAALFFAFARREPAFGLLWGVTVPALARGRANSLGFDLHADDLDLAELRLDVNEGVLDYPSVRAWFRDRLAQVEPRSWPPR